MILALLACGLGSNRNPAGGNPDMETQLTSCTAGAWEVRLYRGNGGATTAFWSTVTVERPGLPERQVYFAYGYPLVDAMRCSPARIELLEGGTAVESLEEPALTGLRDAPVSIWKGKRSP